MIFVSTMANVQELKNPLWGKKTCCGVCDLVCGNLITHILPNKFVVK